MSRSYLFADESGNFDFSRQRGASRYFAVGTMHVAGDEALAALRSDLLALRTELGWLRTRDDDGAFHASEDLQRIRDAVFGVLRAHTLPTDVTILEKSKAQPHLRAEAPAFFGHAWRRHLERVAESVLTPGDEVMVVVAAVGTRRLRAAFRAAVEASIGQCMPDAAVLFTSGESDPALQAADYLLWAVTRAWERNDRRALDCARPNIRSIVDQFARGRTHYY